ncbi:hypothetical protein HN031_15810 [Nocardioides sp. zg-1308]|uniref:TetR family transcriptional regulator n=1 Tax=Nocardioides renjunii TaxID=3095075 RepID=A0ABU5KB47_9ACTN|nr:MULTISPECIES: hypothetical protein [unclassified Nocardioides]MDZ5662147.1 hypothetical protein [Nocardioides sp. S-58]NPD06145.1 hypothetical protein [Nocardioides sp. zg-1308]WQQ24384.1 hypothetical protein SHK17_10425 [Nocardioides sp. S-34]
MDGAEAGRLAGHVLVDLLSVLDDDPRGQDETVDALSLAFERLNEIRAVRITVDPATDELEVDASGLMGGLVLTLGGLAWLLEQRAGMSRTDVTLRMRTFLDGSGEVGT